jgi:hypothetical protein
MTEATPTATPFGGQATPARPSDEHDMEHDEKDNMGVLREKLEQRKKPIYAGLAFLCLVVIGVSIAATSGKSTSANVKSGFVSLLPHYWLGFDHGADVVARFV